MTLVLHPYAGPGGASEGARLAGVADVGIEYDPSACATRRAAGHRTIRADAASFPLDHLARPVDGLIVTPPCQLYSAAGKGQGRSVLPALTDALGALVGGDDCRADVRAAIADVFEADLPTGDQAPLPLPGVPSTARLTAERLAHQAAHVLEPARWVERLRPRWVVLEQVPAVLPLWESLAVELARLAYSSTVGLLNAADYGVAQVRRRAVLIARRDTTPTMPAPTHCADPRRTDLAPWATMATALGWPPGYGPAWAHERPATTIAGDSRCWPPGHKINADDRRRLGDAEAAARYGDRAGTDAVRLTVGDALTLQGFPVTYPLAGNLSDQRRQVGDAFPPPLAAAVIRAAMR